MSRAPSPSTSPAVKTNGLGNGSLADQTRRPAWSAALIAKQHEVKILLQDKVSSLSEKRTRFLDLMPKEEIVNPTEATEQQKKQTALMWAAAQSQPAMVRELIAHGADVNARATVNITRFA